jgi:anti-sigma B factor antagonist
MKPSSAWPSWVCTNPLAPHHKGTQTDLPRAVLAWRVGSSRPRPSLSPRQPLADTAPRGQRAWPSTAVVLATHPDPVPCLTWNQPAMLLDLHVTTTARFTVVEVGGELDLATAPQLRHCLHHAIDGGTRQLVIDLRQVSFIDSVGLGVLVGAHGRLLGRGHEGGSIQLVCAEGLVVHILRLTGLDRLFPCTQLGRGPGRRCRPGRRPIRPRRRSIVARVHPRIGRGACRQRRQGRHHRGGPTASCGWRLHHPRVRLRHDRCQAARS